MCQVFEWYLDAHSVHGIVAKCESLGRHNKEWATKEGKTSRGHPVLQIGVLLGQDCLRTREASQVWRLAPPSARCV
jgi:hypothetical protein